MKMKHTPGPWVAEKIKNGTFFYWQISEKQYNGFQICSTINAEVHQDEANARLIAAAPDLLDAAKDLLLLIEATNAGYLSGDVAQAMMAAIKKAEGAD